jgi:hypothetical protein
MHVLFQVNAFYRPCGDTASCNCAVAVRANDDVVVISKCPPSSARDVQENYPVSVTLHRNGELSPGFRVNKFSEYKYAVSELCRVFRTLIMLREKRKQTLELNLF